MNFWDYHGILFLLGLTFFPRITIFFYSAVFSSVTGPLAFILTVLGFIICPHLLVAILGTIWYWDTNPDLCIIA